MDGLKIYHCLVAHKRRSRLPYLVCKNGLAAGDELGQLVQRMPNCKGKKVSRNYFETHIEMMFYRTFHTGGVRGAAERI